MKNLIRIGRIGLNFFSLYFGFQLFGVEITQSDSRISIPLNDNWYFQSNEPESLTSQLQYQQVKDWVIPSGNAFRKSVVAEPSESFPVTDVPFTTVEFDDSQWRPLDLPHDWGIEQSFDMELPAEAGRLKWWGIGWYRKHFTLDAKFEGKRILLNVGGAMSYAMVWCNGEFVGGWPYGYASWQLDLTPFVKVGGENVIAVRLDNPPESSRWYAGGGLYRDVSLEIVNPVRVDQWGTFVETTDISGEQATIALAIKVRNDSTRSGSVQVHTEIFIKQANGTLKQVERLSDQTAAIAANQTTEANFSGTFQNPKLWSPETPNLYVARTELHQDGRVVDQYETVFGIRHFEFTVDDGFHLNGERYPIKGVCLHHDLGALGAAFNLQAAKRQLVSMKEMGANAIRFSHNPPASELLDLCDEMGFLVEDEAFDMWETAKKENDYSVLFKDWSEADLRAMIRRDRNHASIILWSTGNEVKEQLKPENHGVGVRLKEIVHDEDPTRLVSGAANYPMSVGNGFAVTMDVYGLNYNHYFYDQLKKKNPNTPLIASETVSTVSSRGIYRFPISEKPVEGRVGFHLSSYELTHAGWSSIPDNSFKALEQHPFMAGEFVWTGWDYLGEPTPFNKDLTVLSNFENPEDQAKAAAELAEIGKVRPPSRSSYFGIVDLAGFPKNRYYLYQSHWKPEFPMAHLLPHWNWPDRVGEITPVHVFTSGDEAELFLNGKSLGKKQKGEFEYRLRWDEVVYEPGELKVVAYKNGNYWAEDKVETTGNPTKLFLRMDNRGSDVDGGLVFIEVEVLDEAGREVSNANLPLVFHVEGGAELIATDNGDPTDHTGFSASERFTFNGKALAILRKTNSAGGGITCTVESDGLQPATLEL